MTRINTAELPDEVRRQICSLAGEHGLRKRDLYRWIIEEGTKGVADALAKPDNGVVHRDEPGGSYLSDAKEELGDEATEHALYVRAWQLREAQEAEVSR